MASNALAVILSACRTPIGGRGVAAHCIGGGKGIAMVIEV